MRIQSGTVNFTYGSDLDSLVEFITIPGQVIHIPPKTIHRIEALEDSYIFEISTPELTDVIRHQDDYGRI